MAFHDWNHDGKKDGFDDFVEFSIFNEAMKNRQQSNKDPDNNVSGNTGMGCALFIVILFILCLLAKCS